MELRIRESILNGSYPFRSPTINAEPCGDRVRDHFCLNLPRMARNLFFVISPRTFSVTLFTHCSIAPSTKQKQSFSPLTSSPLLFSTTPTPRPHPHDTQPRPHPHAATPTPSPTASGGAHPRPHTTGLTHAPSQSHKDIEIYIANKFEARMEKSERKRPDS
ncbi:uncharacterized protein LOC130730640 [Lotus japonicus]|uniref:uncharacterized protein LOC130730640 n=1 Tax=Lotus japonicus TaxID=34305 RepID=UPI00258E7753|nr:uncharacterized protein LOC130730640 [Lotus japonicus]